MPKKALVLTVGMGANANPEETLYTPIACSMREAAADTIWLLPSRQSLVHAQLLQERFPHLPIRVAPPLPERGEEDPNACFAFFHDLLGKVLAEGVRPEHVKLDYTRGTKTMSAAVMLAAVSWRIENFLYVSGERGDNNLVTPGTETVRHFSAAHISAYRELEQAEQLMRMQRYSAVETLMDGWRRRYPGDLQARAGHVAGCAKFWDAWDRLEYPEALRSLAEIGAGAEWFTPKELARNAIAYLARYRTGTPLELCEPTWALVFDVLENSRRRLKQGQFEDAFIRVYRSLELIGQAALYGYGIETNGADAERPEIVKWLEYRKKEGKALPEKKAKGYELSKTFVGSLLKHLRSPIANGLNNFDTGREFQAKYRNESLLIHGFAIRATTDRRKDIEGMLEVGLPGLARKGVPDTLRWIEGGVRFPQ